MARLPAWVQPAGPLPGESAGATPVLAVTPRTLGGQVNGLLGYQALRWFTRHHQLGNLLVDVPDPDATPGGADDAAWAYVDPPPIRWTVSPGARLIWVGIWYTAFDRKDLDPSISVELQSTAGEALDDAIVWDIDNGYLEMGENKTRQLAEAVANAGGDAAVGAANVYAAEGPPDLFVETGWSTTVIDNEPRLLVLPDATSGPVQLALTTNGVRVYAITWAEAFLATI